MSNCGLTTGNKAIRVKGHTEKPQRVFMTWLKKALKENPDGKEIPMNYDKLVHAVFRPRRISDVSSYLFFHRITKNKSAIIARFGTFMRGDSSRDYTFIPRRVANPKLGQTERKAPAIEKDPTLKVLSLSIQNAEALNILVGEVTRLAEAVERLAAAK
jgi:hypothetical protein